MEDLKVDRKKVVNYTIAALGLRYVTRGLQDFIFDSMSNTHSSVLQSFQQNNMGMVCNLNCSRVYGSSFGRWCNVCNFWRQELRKLCRYKKHWDRIDWKQVDTSDFSYSTVDAYEAFGKVFVRDTHSVRHGLFNDLGAILSLFLNMKSYTIPNALISKLQRARNLYVAHNYNAMLSCVEKTDCIESALQLLMVTEIRCTTSAKNALSVLKTLKAAEDIPDCILQHPDTKEIVLSVREEFDEGCVVNALFLTKPSTILFKQNLDNLIHYSLQRKPPRKNRIVSYIESKITPWLFFILVVVLTNLLTWNRGTEDEGCLSMRYSSPIKSAFNFDRYVNLLNNASSMERHWLENLTKKKLDRSKIGVLVTADMGFGKSTFISNLLCAGKSSVLSSLREQILVYHFCRYDMRMSSTAGTFILNLASAIASKFQNLGNAIMTDDIASEFLDSNGFRCERYPKECFEHAILTPLQSKWPTQKLIIVVDALDECAGEGEDNSLLEFLYTQLTKFPPNIKFIFTSRNIVEINRKFSQMTRLFLNSSDDRNIKDVRRYVENSGNLSKHQMDNLIEVSAGNFLHAKCYLQYCFEFKDCDFDHVPGSLESLYQFNFERVFKNKNNVFEELIPVLEVLCAIRSPSSQNQILEISNINSTEKKHNIERMLRNELGHFIQNEEGKISFLHKSITDFLTNESRNHTKFYINRENGHSLLAVYLLKTLNVSTIRPEDLSELVYHAASSQNMEYESILLDNFQSLIKKGSNLESNLLFIIVRNYNDYRTTKLALMLTRVAKVDIVNKDNQSLSFIAARQGYVETLKCLLDNGANPRKRVVFDTSLFDKSIPDIFNKNKDYHFRYIDNELGQDIIATCKHLYFCGYTIFHIAAQNGHKNIIKLLLDRHPNMLYTANDMNLTPFHLAVENGHDEIVTILLDRNNSLTDRYSLYQASKNGHFNIVNLLLSYGTKDECLQFDGSFYWLPMLSNRKQQSIKIHEIKNNMTLYKTLPIKTFLYDDWHLITCETALHAAVRNGHINIVKLLIEQPQNSLNCTTFDGKSPLMTAIMHNHTDLFIYLYNRARAQSHICHHKVDIFHVNFQAKLNYREKKRLATERCPSGVTFLHLIASYGNREIVIKVI